MRYASLTIFNRENVVWTAEMKRFLDFGSRFRIGSHRGLASGSGPSLRLGSSFGSVIPALAAGK